MATVQVSVTDTTYTLLSSEDCFITNNSSYDVLLCHSVSLPLIDAPHFVLSSGEGYQRYSGFPAESIYARSNYKDSTAVVSVS